MQSGNLIEQRAWQQVRIAYAASTHPQKLCAQRANPGQKCTWWAMAHLQACARISRPSATLIAHAVEEAAENCRCKVGI